MGNDLQLARLHLLVNKAVLDPSYVPTVGSSEVVVALGQRNVPHTIGQIVLKGDIRPGLAALDGKAAIFREAALLLCGLVSDKV